MCGIVGVTNHPESSIMAYYCLHALQHRGQEAAGIVAKNIENSNGKIKFVEYKDEGLTLDVFSKSAILTETLKGNAAIAHNRYSTTGSNSAANIQPFRINYRMGNLALSHNGNLTNTRELRRLLQNEGAIFSTSTDSEVFLHLIARSKKETQLEQIREALQTTKGAYSLVIMTDKAMYAARDPHGFRPLCIGRKKHNDTYSYIIASETCALDIVSAEYIRDIKHNEIVVIDDEALQTGVIRSEYINEEQHTAHHCVFEYIYFSRPDSKIFGQNVDKIRRKLGKNLAKESPVITENKGEKIISIAVPDSGNTAALGFARQSQKDGRPVIYDIGLIRSHYVGRTFIAPGQDNRELKVKTKFNAVRGVLNGKKIVVVDDSIVRGTTSKSLVKLIREAEPQEIHLRITSPPITHPCQYGMDFPSKKELIANDYATEEEIGKALKVDSLHYLSIESLMDSVPKEEGVDYCSACFTGNYPIKIDESATKLSTEE